MNLITSIDASILLWIQTHVRHAALTSFFRFISFLGNAGWFWILTVACFLLWKQYRKHALSMAATLLVTFLLTTWLKHAVNRPRPYVTIEQLNRLIPALHDGSFPSGHTSASFAVAFAALYVLPKKYSIPMLVLSILIAFSRLYLGVHYPSDVLFGILLAGIVSVLVHLFVRRITARQRCD